MYRGYIKLYRCLKDNPIMQSGDHLKVWLYLLLSANHKEKAALIDGRKIIVSKGAFLTSRSKIVVNTKVERSKVERILKYLETEQQIEQQTFNKFRVISITKWDEYQVDEQQIEQQMSNRRATDEQQMSTNKNDKECIKNDKKEDITLPEFLNSDVWEAFKEMRKKKKATLTNHAINLIFAKLAKFKETGQDPNAILNQSIERSWTGIFEIKEGGANGKDSLSERNRKFEEALQNLPD
jgi:hypothetical protein